MCALFRKSCSMVRMVIKVSLCYGAHAMFCGADGHFHYNITTNASFVLWCGWSFLCQIALKVPFVLRCGCHVIWCGFVHCFLLHFMFFIFSIFHFCLNKAVEKEHHCDQGRENKATDLDRPSPSPRRVFWSIQKLTQQTPSF